MLLFWWLQKRFDSIESKLDQILIQLKITLKTEKELKEMAGKLDDAVARMTTSIENLTTVADSELSLLQQLGDIIRNTEPTAAALNALADKIDSEAQKIVDATVANTPAA